MAANTSDSSMPLVCGSCRRIVETFETTVMPVLDDHKRREFSTHHSSAHDLYESVAKGCWICSIVLARWSDHGALDLRQSEFSAELSRYCIGSKGYLNRYSGASRNDGFIIARSDSSGTDDWVCFDARETDRIHDINTSTSTGSEYAKCQILEWLHSCRGGHKRCNAVVRSQPLPTRLLDVGDAMTARVQIVKSASLKYPSVDYATLSHRWGQIEGYLQLRSSTMAMLQTGIRDDDLPLTFRDAITIARWIKVQYIWIDSLCIQQDSREDRIDECSKMDVVYTNALCNIAATDSTDPTMGIFRTRSPGAITPFTVTKKGLLFDTYVVFNHFWTETLYSSQLNRRGWVLQERLLSRRVIHFGADQIYWECLEMDACERRPSGRGYRQEKFKMLDLSAREPLVHLTHMDTRAEEAWIEIVRKYTSCQLTRSDDKLVALQGLTKVLEKRFRKRCLAGLWEDCLPQALLWRIQEDAVHKAVRSLQYRAPSWSWAAVDGRVLPFSHHNPFGRVKDFALASVIEAHVDFTDRSGHVKDGHVRLKGGVVEGLGGSEVESDDSFSAFYDTTSDANAMSSTGLYSFPVLASKRYWEDKFVVCCLILKRVPHGNEGVYQRIGMFEVSLWVWDIEMMKRNRSPAWHHHWLLVPSLGRNIGVNWDLKPPTWRMRKSIVKVGLAQFAQSFKATDTRLGDRSLYVQDAYGTVVVI